MILILPIQRSALGEQQYWSILPKNVIPAGGTAVGAGVRTREGGIMKIIYPKAILVPKKEETQPTVLIDPGSIIDPKYSSDDTELQHCFSEGVAIRIRCGGEFATRGLYLDDAYDHVVVLDSLGEQVLLRLRKDRKGE